MKKLEDIYNLINTNDKQILTIAGRVGYHKNVLLMQLINKISINKKVLLIDLEQSAKIPSIKLNDNITVIDNIKDIDDIVKECLNLKELSLIAIDHLQAITTNKYKEKEFTGYYEDEIDKYSYIVDSLKELSIDQNIPIIILSQLPRTVEEKKEINPNLNDLNVFGSLKESSNKVMYIYDKNYGEYEETVQLLIYDNSKILDKVELVFDKKNNTFK